MDKQSIGRKVIAAALSASILLCAALPASAASAERKGVDAVFPTFFRNGSGEPSIGVTVRNAIRVNGKYFRDANGNGALDPYEDWRKTPSERADDLIAKMDIDEKVGMMVINTRGMGIFQESRSKRDRSGLLDEEEKLATSNIFGETSQYGTIATIQDLNLRHFILRQNPEPDDLAQWINMMNQAAEADSLGIPVVIASNSRNENADATFGMNDASGVFSTWPGTLGLAAAAKGSGMQLISDFAEIARSEWDAGGIKKGYMYMADVVTDPRWQRTYGTMGEDPAFISEAISLLVHGFQGGNSLQSNGIAMTTKHFPGGGARENGFDPDRKSVV